LLAYYNQQIENASLLSLNLGLTIFVFEAEKYTLIFSQSAETYFAYLRSPSNLVRCIQFLQIAFTFKLQNDNMQNVFSLKQKLVALKQPSN